MRPSSSHSDGLFDAVLGRGGAELDDATWLRAMLDVEAALAAACADAGLIPAAAAREIADACADPGRFDVAALGAAAAASGNPVVPLVRAVEKLVGPAAKGHIHLGATSQDVLDTALVLLARRAAPHLLADLRATADAAAGLASQHRDTPMVGRTLLQQAAPTTFGLKAAGWAVALDHAADRLDAAATGLPVQLGGAAGTLAGYGPCAEQVLAGLAARLGLPEPVLPWHTARGPLADLAGCLGAAAGAVGKVALDLCLLSQTEVAEVREGTPGQGGSSAMPHKHNPVAAVSARAAALRTPGLVATLLTAMAQEHERAAGAWHAEWEVVTDLLRATGSAAAWLRDALEHLVVDADRMAANLQAGGAGLVSEQLAGALSAALGRSAAHDLVAAAADRTASTGRPLVEELAADPGCPLDVGELAAAAVPSTGAASRLVDRALSRRGS